MYVHCTMYMMKNFKKSKSRERGDRENEAVVGIERDTQRERVTERERERDR